MKVTRADELDHTPSDDPLWRESLYFGFHDADGRVGGMTTIGILPNQQRGQGYAALFLGTHRVLFYHTEHPWPDGKTSLCALPGTAYQVLDPLNRWRFAVTSEFTAIDPHQVVRGIRRPAEIVPVHFELTFTALSRAYEFPADVFPLLTGEARHYEQTGRINGEMAIGGEEFVLDGFGYRDHSWGIRDLSRTSDIVGICAQFGAHFAVNAFWAKRQGRKLSLGYVSQSGENTPLKNLQISVEMDPSNLLPKGGRAEIETADGRRFGLQAEVRSVMPVLLDHGGSQLFWYECSTRFNDGQQTGFGTLTVTRSVPRDRNS